MTASRIIITCVIYVSALIPAHAELLLHYTFDENTLETCLDSSPNTITGQVTALRSESPSGKCLSLDGTPSKIASVDLPEALRFGDESWSFTAWLNPQRLDIDARQNQRRIFSYGTYPDANLVIDLTHQGLLTVYCCYRDANGDIISTSATSPLKIPVGSWTHVALVCDRTRREIRPYINGYCAEARPISPEFKGIFNLSGRITLGSSWQNYFGRMDEVRIYRNALTQDEVIQIYDTDKAVFAPIESEIVRKGKQKLNIENLYIRLVEAWQDGDFDTVRKICKSVISNTQNAPKYRSDAHLRLAQSYLVEGNKDAALAEYRNIIGNTDYPKVHRFEASEYRDRLQGTPYKPGDRLPNISTPSYFDYSLTLPNLDSTTGGTLKDAALRFRDAVRAGLAKGEASYEIILPPGVYPINKTLSFDQRDSGSEDAPIVYRAEQPGTVVFYGGRPISDFTLVEDPTILQRLPESARTNVFQCDLKAQGITDYGTLQVRGFGQPDSPPTLELYFNGHPMTPARWPNQGFVEIDQLLQPGDFRTDTPSIFTYIDDRHARWTQAKDPWIFGYFRYLWADAALPIAKIDTQAHTLTTAQPYRYSGSGMSTDQGIIYYTFNLLEEIDTPGEWYLDREAGVLYFYPPSDPNNATVEVSILDEPMISLQGANDIRFQGITFALGRYNAIQVQDCSRVYFIDCEVKRFAGSGISIQGGTQCGILSSTIHTLGRRGTEIIGGNRETLTPAKHFVENSEFYNFGRIDRTYTPAIQLEGVGNRVAHNYMHDCPSSVLRVEGNDHIIEFNRVENAVQESDDQGAMEMFGNPSYRGVIFRYNSFEDIGKIGEEISVHGQAAIRLDDAISGIVVYGNIFGRCSNGHFGAVQINSGRDNIIDNNYFAYCAIGISGGWNSGNNVWKDLNAGNSRRGVITNELYYSRYPEMRNMLQDSGINHVWGNVMFFTPQITTGNPAYLDSFQNINFEVLLSSAEAMQTGKTAAFITAGFAEISRKPIGLYNDTYRSMDK